MEYKNVNDFEVLYLIEENQSDYKNVLFDKYAPILKKFAHSCYEKVKKYGYEYDDCFQEALIGLNYAIDHFTESRGVKFYTYAVLCIKSKLNSFLNRVMSNKNRALNESLLFSDSFNNFENLEYTSFESDYLSFYDKVLRFKNSLSDNQAQVFELKYNGFSNKDIAVLLDTSPKYVSTILIAIKNKMVMSGFIAN